MGVPVGPRLREKAPGLHRFLTREDSPYPAVREVVAGALVILLLLGCLYAFTAQPIAGGYPVVVVTSGSMMHCTNAGEATASLGKGCIDPNYGRIGTIDPGDLVFVRHITQRTDVSTLAAAGSGHYGKAGDVIVYRPGGSTQVTPIIHRALFWVQVNDSDNTYSVPDLNLYHVATLDQPQVTSLAKCALGSSGPHHWTMADSGFITKGDNNQVADQCSGSITFYPAKLDWVLGKARGELPWFGLIKLFVDDLRGPTQNFSNASSDSKVMLAISLGVLIALPYGVTALRNRARGKKATNDEPVEPPTRPS